MEEFKQIAGHPNYEVSSRGRVRNISKNIFLKVSNTDNYQSVGFAGQSFRIHRLMAIAFLDPVQDKPEVDHIDRNPQNNVITNLRWVNRFENAQNRKVPTSNKSGVKGVCFDKNAKQWRAEIVCNGKYHYIGLYSTLEEATQARQRMEIKLNYLVPI